MKAFGICSEVGLKEGLKEVIPDILEAKVSEVDRMREKVGVGVEGPGIAQSPQVALKETPERLVDKLVAYAGGISRENGIEADCSDEPK